MGWKIPINEGYKLKSSFTNKKIIGPLNIEATVNYFSDQKSQKVAACIKFPNKKLHKQYYSELISILDMILDNIQQNIVLQRL